MTDAVTRLAALGFEKLARLSPDVTERAAGAAATMAARLPVDLAPDKEPATIFQPDDGSNDD
jgi:hypothetical protein